eukprot:jgi/Mesvir1/7497/Mv25821-RA.1
MGLPACTECLNCAATCSSPLLTEHPSFGWRPHRFPSSHNVRAPSHSKGRLDCLGQRLLLRHGTGLSSLPPHPSPLSWRHSSFSTSVSGRWQGAKLNPISPQSLYASPPRSPDVFEPAPRLRDKYPGVAAQYHPTRNRDEPVSVDGIGPFSSAMRWWKCDKGPDHEWQARVVARTSGGRGCPCCAGQQLSVTNSIAAKFPEIAAQLHPTKNGPNVDGSKILAGTVKKVWWKCDKGPDHEWQATVKDRTSGGTGCPCCAGQQLSVTNSLIAKFPQIAAELHPTKNGPNVDGSKILAGTAEKFWWKCDKGPDHGWEATVDSRTSGGSGCPCCAGRQLSITNSLTALYPQIAAELHPTKNGPGVDRSKILAGTCKKFWWKCEEGPDHEWQATVDSRTSGGSGCPCCAGRQLSVTNSLTAKFPQIAAELHPTKNGPGVDGSKILAGTAEKFWWKCDKGPDHEWDATVNHRTSAGKGCPCCAGRQLSITNSLTAKFPHIAAELHPTKNGPGMDGSKILAGTCKKFWWKCDKGPDHEWEATVDSRTSGGCGCPCCAGLHLSVTNSLTAKFPHIAAELHPTKNGPGVDGSNILAGTHKKFWWKCDKGPDHEWEAKVADRTSGGTGCPYCAGQRLSVTNSLTAKFPQIAEELHPTKNGPHVDGSKILAGTNKKFLWKCDKGPDHEWEARVANRTSHGTGCPFCSGRRASVTNNLATNDPAVAA